MERSYPIVTQIDGFKTRQSPKAASLEVGHSVVTEVKFFETDDVHEAVLTELLDGVPAEVQLFQGLDDAHGSSGDGRVHEPVASQADLS